MNILYVILMILTSFVFTGVFVFLVTKQGFTLTKTERQVLTNEINKLQKELKHTKEKLEISEKYSIEYKKLADDLTKQKEMYSNTQKAFDDLYKEYKEFIGDYKQKLEKQ